MLTSSLLNAKGQNVRLHTAAGVFEGKVVEFDGGIDLIVLESDGKTHVAISAVVAIDFPAASRSVGF